MYKNRRLCDLYHGAILKMNRDYTGKDTFSIMCGHIHCTDISGIFAHVMDALMDRHQQKD